MDVSKSEPQSVPPLPSNWLHYQKEKKKVSISRLSLSLNADLITQLLLFTKVLHGSYSPV